MPSCPRSGSVHLSAIVAQGVRPALGVLTDHESNCTEAGPAAEKQCQGHCAEYHGIRSEDVRFERPRFTPLLWWVIAVGLERE